MTTIRPRLCALCGNRALPNCICSAHVIKTIVDEHDDLHRVMETLARKGRWKHIEEIIRLNSADIDYAKSLRHTAYKIADTLLEEPTTRKKSNAFNDGCILCDGYMPYLCDELCDESCKECNDFESHYCSQWRYKYTRVLMKPKCIICNHKATTACLSCKGLVCSTCFTDKRCTCRSYYDGSMHSVEETALYVLARCGLY